MKLARLVTAVASAWLLVLPATAPAAPWAAPQAVPGGHLARWETVTSGGVSAGALHGIGGLLGFTPGGTGFAVMGRDGDGRGFTRFDPATGTFATVRESALGSVEPTLMALYAREGVLLAGAADAQGDPRAQRNPAILLDAAVTRGRVDGTFARRQVLAHGVGGDVAAPAVPVALAANTAGDAAVVVSVPEMGRARLAGYRARLFIRRHGQSSFNRVADLGRRTVGRSPAALAINGPGDVLVAWDDRTDVAARVVTARGRLLGVQRLGPGGSSFAYGGRMSASMDATRRAVVAWMGQRIGEGGYAGAPGTVSYAYASAYKAFGTARVLQTGLPRGSDRGIGAPGVAATLLRGGALVTWTGFVDGRYAVRAVDVTRGRPGAVAELSPAGSTAVLQGLAVGPRGGVVVTWAATAAPTSVPLAGSGVSAAARAAGSATWGPAEPVSAPTPMGEVPVGGAVAADPVTGKAVVLWSSPLTAPPAPMPALFSVRAAAA